MKKFTETSFFNLIKTNPDALQSSLEDEYDAFAFFVAKESSEMEISTCHDALIYTHAELASLLETSEKKACE